MAIIGVTCTKDGELIQRLPVSTKVAIGLPPKGYRNYPERLDHFIFLKRGTEKGSWIPNEELMQHYAPECKHDISDSCPKCCRQVKILLLDDDIENVFNHLLVWWSRTGRKCWGDGETATRRTEENPNGQPWSRCRNAGCPDWERGDCAASGDLRFCLADFPVLGSVARIHTSSLRSVKNIASALSVIQGFTGGRLLGVTVPLCVDQNPTSYEDDHGNRKSTVVPILSIRTGVQDLISSVKLTMELWQGARSSFVHWKRLVPFEDEREQGLEISAEFAKHKELPAGEAPKPEPPKPAEPTKPPQPPPEQAKKPEPIKPTGREVLDGVVASVVERDNKGKKYQELSLKSVPKDGRASKLKVILLPGTTPEVVFAGVASAVKQAEREVEVSLTCDVYEAPGKPKTLCAMDFAFKASAPPDLPAAETSGTGEYDWMLGSPKS